MRTKSIDAHANPTLRFVLAAIAIACIVSLVSCSDTPSSSDDEDGANGGQKITVKLYRSHEGISNIVFDGKNLGSVNCAEIATTEGNHSVSWSFNDAHTEGTCKVTEKVTAKNPYLIITNEALWHVSDEPLVSGLEITGIPYTVVVNEPISLSASGITQYTPNIAVENVDWYVDGAKIEGSTCKFATKGNHTIKAVSGTKSSMEESIQVYGITEIILQKKSGDILLIKGKTVVPCTLNLRMKLDTTYGGEVESDEFDLTCDGAAFSGRTLSADDKPAGEYTFVATRNGLTSKPLKVFIINETEYGKYAKIDVPGVDSDNQSVLVKVFSPDNKLLAIAAPQKGANNKIFLYKLEAVGASELDKETWPNSNGFCTMIFSEDGTKLAVADELPEETADPKPTISVYDVNESTGDLALLHTYSNFLNRIVDMAFTSSNTLLVSTQNTAYTWADGASEPVENNTDYKAKSVFSDNGKFTGYVTSSETDTTLTLKNIDESTEKTFPSQGFSPMYISLDGKTVVLGSSYGWHTTILIRDVENDINYSPNSTWYDSQFDAGTNMVIGNDAGSAYALYHLPTGMLISTGYMDLDNAPTMYSMSFRAISRDGTFIASSKLYGGQTFVLKRK